MTISGVERPTFCDDWRCPARVSCARHFGRSKEYASMSEPPAGRSRHSAGHGAGTIYCRGKRDHCSHYELDQPREWLMLLEGQVTHYGSFRA